MTHEELNYWSFDVSAKGVYSRCVNGNTSVKT